MKGSAAESPPARRDAPGGAIPLGQRSEMRLIRTPVAGDWASLVKLPDRAYADVGEELSP